MINKQGKENSISVNSICLIITMIIVLFLLFFCYYMPLDFDNLGGKHAWVSGSTIKYVNMWLEEGAANLHFTNIELFPSIEFSTTADRLPYVSYPTGTTFMVWIAAKLMGYSHIDISFLKHFQLIVYAVENVLLSAIVYLCLSSFLRVREVLKVLISIILTSIWLTLPFNNWFMTNIYWTDIAVFLWIIAFLLLETMSEYINQSSKANVILSVAKCIIIFAGVMTEYYFWIVVFVAYVHNCIKIVVINRESMARLDLVKKVVKESATYVIPVIFGLLIFLWQISYTDNWIEQLVNTFLHRTGAQNNEVSVVSLYDNYIKAVVCDSNIRGMMLLAIEAIVVILAIVIIIIRRVNLIELIGNKIFVVLFIMIASPIIQILLFSNHSAIHQYAFVKMGLHLIGMLILCIWCARQLTERTWGYVIAGLVTSFYLVALGYPSQVRGYYNAKNTIDNYTIAKIIYENTEYEDVCFSFTYSINNNPPMDISVSEKAVYLVESIEDMYSMFEYLPQEANRLLIIDRNNIGSNDYIEREKTDRINELEALCISKGQIRYQDKDCIIVEMPDTYNS